MSGGVELKNTLQLQFDPVVELPENPRERVGSLPVDDETFDAVLQEFVDRIELELQHILEFDTA